MHTFALTKKKVIPMVAMRMPASQPNASQYKFRFAFNAYFGLGHFFKPSSDLCLIHTLDLAIFFLRQVSRLGLFSS